MAIKTVYNNLNTKAHEISREIWYSKCIKKRYANLKGAQIPIKTLSAAQKKQIDDVWGPLCTKDYKTHELLYSLTGKFDPTYCSERLFTTKLEFALNDPNYTKAWSDKNYFDRLFPEVRFPYSIIRNISGSFYNHNYQKIERADVKRLLADYEFVCIKPTIQTGSGQGVKKIRVDENLDSVLDTYKQNYIIQEILEQYAPLKALNESSVNIIRYMTLFLNDHITPFSATLRCGAEGAFNDNSQTKDGRGRFAVGVTDDGVLKDIAHYGCGLSLKKAPNGADFAGLKLPNFDKVKQMITDMSSKMPFARFVGFDIAFDINGEPVVMEYNLYAPGTFYYQIANGPLFGERTQEVINTFGR